MWTITIVEYKDAMRSAIYGIEDLFTIANRFLPQPLFSIEHYNVQRSQSLPENHSENPQIIFLPPCSSDPLPSFREKKLTDWLQAQSQLNTTIAASCAGVFWLGSAGLLDDKVATTHWKLCNVLAERYPAIKMVEKRDVVVDQGNIVTAAGLFAYQDLALHMIARSAGYDLAKQVADFSLLDLNGRLQAYYERFAPNLSHGDTLILDAQKLCEEKVTISVKELAEHCSISERSLHRKFVAATGLSPKQYLTSTKIERARTLLAQPKMSVEKVAYELGYMDVSNFNRTFRKETGITPSAFRARQQ